MPTNRLPNNLNNIPLDEIRNKAIEVIRENPEGIRQTALIFELYNLLHDRLSGSTDPKARIRNAVWNLETKTDQVIKQSVGPREVVFLPVISPTDNFYQYSENGVVKEAVVDYCFTEEHANKEQDRVQKMIPVWYLLSEIEAVISKNEGFLNRLLYMTPDELATLSKDDVETIFELKQATAALRRARNNIAHKR